MTVVILADILAEIKQESRSVIRTYPSATLPGRSIHVRPFPALPTESRPFWPDVRWRCGKLQCVSKLTLSYPAPHRCVGSDQRLPLGSYLLATCRFPSKTSPVGQSVTID